VVGQPTGRVHPKRARHRDWPPWRWYGQRGCHPGGGDNGDAGEVAGPVLHTPTGSVPAPAARSCPVGVGDVGWGSRGQGGYGGSG